MSKLLDRQLKRAGCTADATPEVEAWLAFLASVERAYEAAEKDRYLVERSLDISSQEMRTLHEMLAAERDTIRTVIHSLFEGVCALTRDGDIMLINPAGRRLLGIDADETTMIGKRFADVVELCSPDGTKLTSLLPDLDMSEMTNRRLVVPKNPDVQLMFDLRPLSGGRTGYVLTIRDESQRLSHEAEVAELNQHLVDLSRKAGMAEVASGVIHNVGNVLNSINVSAALIGERLKQLRLAGLAKAAAMMQSNEADLATFLAQDSTGSKLPAYVEEVARHLADEQQLMQAELALLINNIEHINGIVSCQQAHVGAAARVQEEESIPSLLADALRMTCPDFERHGIRVFKDIVEVPRVWIDRSQALQILVNLLTNAKEALSGNARGEKEIRLTVRQLDEPHPSVTIEVRDNGKGIKPEDINRIFGYGYTTRVGGHGLGLHTAATGAMAMHARLTAQSDGPGRGAAFTLNVPINRIQERVAA